MRPEFRHPAVVFGAVALAALVAVAAGAPLIEQLLGIDPEAQDLLSRFAAPSAEHPLGADELGRDVLSRLLRGGRVSLAVGFMAALAAATIGTMVGLVAGYGGGRLDAALMRLTDGVIALPLLPLLIVLAAADPAKLGLPDTDSGGVARVVGIVALVGWTTVARLVRAATLSVRERDYVRAAVALGAGPARVVARHILPNVASPIVVATTLSVGHVILLESALSFLGLGVRPPLPSWGNMLNGALEMIWSAPAQAVWPGAMIFTTVLGFNVLGDGLRAALDPKGR